MATSSYPMKNSSVKCACGSFRFRMKTSNDTGVITVSCAKCGGVNDNVVARVKPTAAPTASKLKAAASRADSAKMQKALDEAGARKPVKDMSKPKLCYVCRRKPADPHCVGACNSPRCMLQSMRDNC